MFDFSKEELQELLDTSCSFREVIRKCGHSDRSANTFQIFKKKIEGLDLTKINHNRTKRGFNNGNSKSHISEHLVKDSDYPRGHLKTRILKEGLLENKCSVCNMEGEWMGKPIVMILDHINGVNNDNRLENLRMVCPNCNSQLDTHCGKGKKKLHLCDCGKEKDRNAKQCNGCSSISKRKVERPSLETLLKEVKETSYRETGEKYGVSDNAIRKWIKTYGGVPPKKQNIVS